MPPSPELTIAPEADVDKVSSKDEVSAAESFQENPSPSPTDDVDKENVDEAVAVLPLDEPTDEEQGNVPLTTKSTGGVEIESSPPPTPIHPPSFFTNNRGNLKVVAFVVRNPCLVFSLIIVLCIIIAFLLQLLVFRASETGNPFTLPGNEFDMNDVRSLQYDSYRLAKDEVKAAREAVEAEGVVTLKQSELSAIAMWVFEADENNKENGVFGSKESIAAMKDAYDIFLDDPGFSDYCWLDYRKGNETNRPCQMPLTPLAMYYASEWDEDKVAYVIEQLKVPSNIELFNSLALCYTAGLYCDLVPTDVTPEEIAWVVEFGANVTDITSKFDMQGEMVENYNQVTELASYLIQVDVFKGTVDYGYDTEFSAENPVSQYSRGIVFWGGPLESRNVSASDEEANEEVKDNERDELKEFIKTNYLVSMDEQSDKSTHGTINSYYFMTAIIGDVILNIVTKDAMLALFSFAFIFFWLRLNTRSWFLAFVGLFEIFFSIPIAWFIFTVIFQIKYFATLNALALFVVAAIGADDIFIFMDAYKQSQYHLDVLTDLETRMSWVYRRTGTAMAITSATTCAAFLCTLITPLTSIQSFGIFAAVVIFIDYVLVMSLFCTSVVIYHNRYENSAPFGCCCPCGPVVPSNTDQAREALAGSEGEIKRDFVSEFFRTKVAGFVKVPLHRLVLCILFLTWLGCAIWQATLIEATKESEQFLSEDHPLQKSLSILDKQFPTADDDLGLKVHYVWGVDQVDRTGVNRLLEPEYFGKPTFVEEFDFNQQCQTDILEFCDTLRTDPLYQDLIKRKNGLGLVYCFIEELGAFNVKGDLDDCDYVRQGEWKTANVTWQVDPNDLATIMPEFLKQKTCYDESELETVSGRYSEMIGFDGKSMRYAAVAAESAVLDPFGIDGEQFTREQYDQFVAIAEKQDKIVQSCSGEVIMTDLDEKFVFMNNQNIYVRSAIQSACLGVAIAFVVLLISTRVLHLAFFASLSIISVLVSVVGTMVILGWNLGSIESILIAIIAGFSVDYVVHLAHAYEIANGDTYARITEAFADLGISVFNGMITSVVASIPLFFCQLQFFAKFGTFLCLTIAFSWIFANFGFMSILATLKIPVKQDRCINL